MENGTLNLNKGGKDNMFGPKLENMIYNISNREDNDDLDIFGEATSEKSKKQIHKEFLKKKSRRKLQKKSRKAQLKKGNYRSRGK